MFGAPTTQSPDQSSEAIEKAVIYLSVILITAACTHSVLNPLIGKVLKRRQKSFGHPDQAKPTEPTSPPRSPDTIHLSKRHNKSANKDNHRSHSVTVTPVTKANKISSTHYGLAAGEAAVLDSEDDDYQTTDEITDRELRRLHQSPEFKRWRSEKNYTNDDLENVSKRLHLYRSLRRLHPASFWQLCASQSRIGIDSQPPSHTIACLEYLSSLTVNILTVIALAVVVYWQQQPVIESDPLYYGKLAVSVFAAWMLTCRQWLSGRPTFGPLYKIWYEGAVTGHAVSAARAVAANVLETFYVTGTMGVGVVISLCMRVLSGDGQCVGEKLAGVRIVRELIVRLDE